MGEGKKVPGDTILSDHQKRYSLEPGLGWDEMDEMIHFFFQSPRWYSFRMNLLPGGSKFFLVRVLSQISGMKWKRLPLLFDYTLFQSMF